MKSRNTGKSLYNVNTLYWFVACGNFVSSSLDNTVGWTNLDNVASVEQKGKINNKEKINRGDYKSKSYDYE